jgi:hypothetical protein
MLPGDIPQIEREANAKTVMAIRQIGALGRKPIPACLYTANHPPQPLSHPIGITACCFTGKSESSGQDLVTSVVAERKEKGAALSGLSATPSSFFNHSAGSIRRLRELP